MLERFIELYDDVRSATLDLTGTWWCKPEDLDKLVEIYNALHPLEIAIKKLGARGTTLMDAEKIYSRVKQHLQELGSDIAIQLRSSFVKRILERRNSTLVHLLYFLKFPNYWNFEKDSFDIPVVKEDIIKLATQLACCLFPSDVRNPDDLELDSQGDIRFFEKKSKIEKPNATFSEKIDFDLDEESNECGNFETQKLPTVCEEMIKYASNPKGVMPVVLIKLQNALKSIQPSSVEPERCFSTCGFYGPKVRSSLSDKTLSDLLFLNRHFKKLSKSDLKSEKKPEFKAAKMKPMRVMQQHTPKQSTPKAKTRFIFQKRKTPNDSKRKSSQKAKRRKLEKSSDSEDYEEKDLVDDNSDGSLNFGNSDEETQI